MNKQFWIFLVLSGFFIAPLLADDNLAFTNLRQKGMGGAGIARTFDSSALYINPAGLARAKFSINLPLRVRADVGTSFLDKLSSYSDLINASSKSQRSSNLAKLLPITIPFGYAISPVLAFTQENFSVGLFCQGNTSIKLVNPVSPEFQMSGYTDISPMIGLSDTYTVAGQKVSLGATLRYVSRSRLIDATGSFVYKKQIADLLADTKQDLSASVANLSGIGGDVGAMMPVGEGNFGAVLYNLGSSLSGEAVGRTLTEQLPMHLGIGYAQPVNLDFIPFVGSYVGTLDTAIDLKLLNNDMYKNIYMGVEKKILGDVLSLRGGLHQGYPTLGLSVDLMVIKFNYAYYTEEFGAKLGYEPQSFHGIETVLLF